MPHNHEHPMSSRFQIDSSRAIIFDVDGTLYDAGRLRRRMLRELIAHCLANPRRLPLLRTLQVYRRERERLAEQEAAEIILRQYRRPAERLGLTAEQIEQTVSPWIHQRPLRHLAPLRIPGIRRFFGRLRSAGTKIAVYSDYPAATKLEALGLDADLVVTATDAAVDRLKPHTAGLEMLLRKLELEPGECVLIGDRDERDGEVARRLRMPYLLRKPRIRDPQLEFVDYLEL